MNRVPLVSDSEDPEVQRSLDELKRTYGRVPNFYAVLAQSPAALRALMAFDDAIDNGRLDPKLTEQVALFAAQFNRCEYCVAAHSAAARAAGLTSEERDSARRGESADRRTATALRLAREMLEHAGQVSDEALAAARDEGFDNSEIVELVAHVSSNIFTNYLSRLAETEIDYPRVSLDHAAVAA